MSVLLLVFSALCVISVGTCLWYFSRNCDAAIKKAEKFTSESQKYATNARDDSNKARELREKFFVELNEVKRIKDDLSFQLNTQNENFKMMVTWIKILFAIEELRLNETADINERMKEVDDKVKDISKPIDQNNVIQLKTALVTLQREVGKYQERVEALPEGDENQLRLKKSKLVAVSWQNKTLNEAIAHCDALLLK